MQKAGSSMMNLTPGGFKHANHRNIFARARGSNFRQEGAFVVVAYFIAAALAIVLIACALGRVTFQSGSDAWKPLGATEDSSVGQ